MDADVLVRDYLGRLEAASWPLAPPRRAELIGEVREHIETALSEAGQRDEVTVRNVLERLGPPEEIVALESNSTGSTPPSASTAAPAQPLPAASPWGPIEIIALLLLSLGSVFLPFVGPLLGLVFVWASSQWTRQEKLIGTAIVLVLFLPILLLFAARVAVDTGSGPMLAPNPSIQAYP
jgi:hypothetical protein